MTHIKLLYGSRARGEADAQSDVDILTISDSGNADYTWSDLALLREYGSLFLWHLKLEAVVLESDPRGSAMWNAAIADLPPYKRVSDDLDAFELVLRDVLSSLDNEDAPPEFEGAVVARTVRHAAILACFIAGRPTFSRYGAVSLALQSLRISDATIPFERLYDLVLEPETVRVDRATVHEWARAGLSLVTQMRNEEGSR